jgi:hypothetical protein
MWNRFIWLRMASGDRNMMMTFWDFIVAFEQVTNIFLKALQHGISLNGSI